MQISVYVRPNSAPAEDQAARDRQNYLNPAERTYLEPAQLEERSGARQQDLNAVQAYAKQHDLGVIEVNPAQRKIVLDGTAAQFEKAFDVALERYKVGGTVHRVNAKHVHVPPELSGIVTGVLGFDTTPIAKPR